MRCSHTNGIISWYKKGAAEMKKTLYWGANAHIFCTICTKSSMVMELRLQQVLKAPQPSAKLHRASPTHQGQTWRPCARGPLFWVRFAYRQQWSWAAWWSWPSIVTPWGGGDKEHRAATTRPARTLVPPPRHHGHCVIFSSYAGLYTKTKKLIFFKVIIN